jgi:alkylresorcinol/alkylpyrone synthase
MARMAGVSIATPSHRLTAEGTSRELGALLPPRAAAVLPRLIEQSRIDTRYTVAPLADVARLHTMEERSREFVRHAVPLGASAARRALESARLRPDEVEALVCVTSTSFLVPSLDSLLVRELGLPPTCRRLPINQLGCSGGVAGIGLAGELASAKPGRSVLLVSVELPSLSLPIAEPSAADVAACTLLGDGAAAAVLSSRPELTGHEILDARTVLLPETREGGGSRLTEAGFRMIEAIGLPRLARRRLNDLVTEFLAPYELTPEAVAFWVINPRSPRILEAMRDALHLGDDALAPTWAAWKSFGNTISATVLFVADALRARRPSHGSLGLMLSFGAGVTCEMALVRWDGGACEGRRAVDAAASSAPSS